MSPRENLMETISQTWGISRGDSESSSDWMARILYSLLGRMGYAASRDVMENGEPASIVHIKQRMEDVFVSYMRIYPELKGKFPDISDLKDYLYRVLMEGGQVYHLPDRVIPAMETRVQYRNVEFTRGTGVSEKERVSGVGTYRLQPSDLSDPSEAMRMFQLTQRPLTEVWHTAASCKDWRELRPQQGLEYLRMAPPFTRGYWTGQPDQQGRVSLCRIRGYQSTYYLYKQQGKAILAHQLPPWITEQGQYRLLANGCLASAGVLPPAEFRRDGPLIRLKLNYLPPPAELSLIRLYSWPAGFYNLRENPSFNWCLSPGVFFTIASILEASGYQFEEGE